MDVRAAQRLADERELDLVKLSNANPNMKLPLVHDEQGNEVQLTQGNFGVFRESRDRKVREEAFRAMFGAYRQFGDTFAALYGGAVKMDNFK